MPALVKSSVGSFAGTSEELRTILCPRSSKNFRNVALILFPGHFSCSASTQSSQSVSRIKSLSQTHSVPATQQARVGWGFRSVREVFGIFKKRKKLAIRNAVE